MKSSERSCATPPFFARRRFLHCSFCSPCKCDRHPSCLAGWLHPHCPPSPSSTSPPHHAPKARNELSATKAWHNEGTQRRGRGLIVQLRPRVLVLPHDARRRDARPLVRGRLPRAHKGGRASLGGEVHLDVRHAGPRAAAPRAPPRVAVIAPDDGQVVRRELGDVSESRPHDVWAGAGRACVRWRGRNHLVPAKPEAPA